MSKIGQYEKISSYLNNKQYDRAFRTLYADSALPLDYERIIIPLLESDRCRGNFIAACKVYEATVEEENYLIEKAKKSKRVKLFSEEAKEFKSGYVMGEYAEIVLVTANRRVVCMIHDNRRYYSGRYANRNNRYINHGLLRLVADLTCTKAKYTVERRVK